MALKMGEGKKKEDYLSVNPNFLKLINGQGQGGVDTLFAFLSGVRILNHSRLEEEKVFEVEWVYECLNAKRIRDVRGLMLYEVLNNSHACITLIDIIIRQMERNISDDEFHELFNGYSNFFRDTTVVPKFHFARSHFKAGLEHSKDKRVMLASAAYNMEDELGDN